MAEEIFDVVDEHDQVIGQAPRSVVHAKKLLHRAVHILVLNSRGELLLQKRSALKDEYPCRYTTSASGHLSAGESYETAAPRELEEELGLHGELVWLAKFPAGPETSYEHTVVYEMTTDQEPRIDPVEIDAATFHSFAEVEEMLSQDPAAFSPCFSTLFHWYVEQRNKRAAAQA
ncbi:MAG: NUDIX domain-containing protein [Planctomycetes bacterium]|nr:NUDIX domain-containing protein [Planctomycetota bacterium]